MSVIKRLSFYEFTVWGRDLVSVVRIRESPYYRGFFFFFYIRILSGHWKRNKEERCPYREVLLYLTVHILKKSFSEIDFF